MGPMDVLRTWAVQDSPPGAAVTALVARCDDLPAGWLDEAIYEHRTAVALYNPRSATAVVPADEAAAYGTAFLPTDDAGLKAIVANAVPDRDEGFAEPVALAVGAIEDALDGVTLSRDELHEQLRHRLPGALLPWCASCESHHARRGLLIMAALNGRLCIAGRAGRQPAFARTDQLIGWAPPDLGDAQAELVRRYRRTYGATTVGQFAQWAGLGTAHARALWERADAAGGDAPRLPGGVRLLGPGDPVLLTRDREALIPDPAIRRRLWANLNAAGLVVSDGAPAALWRARKRGRRLDVTVEPFAPVDLEAVRAQAERLAPHRGCTSVALNGS
jgi:hypothetical protein